MAELKANEYIPFEAIKQIDGNVQLYQKVYPLTMKVFRELSVKKLLKLEILQHH